MHKLGPTHWLQLRPILVCWHDLARGAVSSACGVPHRSRNLEAEMAALNCRRSGSKNSQQSKRSLEVPGYGSTYNPKTVQLEELSPPKSLDWLKNEVFFIYTFGLFAFSL